MIALPEYMTCTFSWRIETGGLPKVTCSRVYTLENTDVSEAVQDRDVVTTDR